MNLETWGDVATEALSMLGISGVTAPPSSEDIQKVIRRANLVISDLENKGIFIGANLPRNVLASTIANIPDYYELGFITQLALVVASDFGIAVPMSLKALAKSSMNNMYSNIPPVKVQNPFQPTGQGDRRLYERYRFMTRGYGFYPRGICHDASS